MNTETNIKSILATAPSTYNLLSSAHALFTAIEHQAAIFESFIYKEFTPDACEKLRNCTEVAADLAFRARAIVTAAAVLSDLHQITTPPTPAVEDAAAEEELPI